MSFVIKQPVTQEEFKQYFHLRWKILRAPWQQPEGSEIDDIEDQCFHAMAVTTNNKVIGVARLQFNTETEAQIRYMAVDENYERQGVGRKLVSYLETRALETKTEDQPYIEIVLDAREKAVGFYQKLDYKIKGKSYLLFDLVQHFKMVKKLQ